VELGAAPAYAGAQRRSPAWAAFKPPASCIGIFFVEVCIPSVAALAGTARRLLEALRINPPHTISNSGGKIQNDLARR
jgi:hypothetical protein